MSGHGPRIGVVDYGVGNRRSVEKALEHVGARTVISGDHDTLRAADGLVVPGVGAFPRAMANLRERGLDELLRERAGEGTPLLGLCLGLQVLFERSSEHGSVAGLGLLEGEVGRLDSHGAKLPHIGWSLVRWQQPGSPLTAGLPGECAFYHVHSYAVAPARDTDVLGTAEYGQRFTSAVARDRVFGVQFHPEKSSRHGLALLRNFAAICARVPA